MKLRKFSNASMLAALFVLAPIGLISCTGDTDGGSAAGGALDSDPFIDNGGAGAKLEIELNSDNRTDGGEVGVGEEIEFRVHVTDANGAPMEFVRVFCDSELGLAIIEPSANGVAIESTNSRGYMSGSLGGVTPGSFLLECRAQSGFNILDRTTVRVTGSVLPGFQGFPGAAGGNLGGGRIIDQTPDANDGNGIRIAAVVVSDASSGTSGVAAGPLDVSRNGCYVTTAASGSTPATTTCTNEPFVFNTFSLTIKNDTAQSAFINTVEVRQGSRTVVSAQGTPIEIKQSGATGTVQGILTTGINCSDDKCFNTGGTNNLTIGLGTRNYTFIVTGTTEGGDSFEVTRTAAIQFDNVNNCAAGARAGVPCP